MTSPEAAKPGPVGRLMSTGFGLVAFGLAAMWLIEAVDSVILNDSLQGGGIHPRRSDGIDGILWAPLLHGDWDHLISNSIPFIVLGALVALSGIRKWLGATLVITLLGGALTWIFARGGNHVGASGLIFGYLGYLVAAAVFERKIRSIIPALIAIALYGGIWVGLKPTQGISWEGHVFGAIAGVVAASALKPKALPELSELRPR